MSNGWKSAALALAFAGAPLPAFAGDAANINILGFNEGAGIFAFEQYGEQDGSGFMYAERFYIDTATDRFVQGSPIKIQAENEDTTLAQVRDQARAKGEKIISDAELTENWGYTSAFNPIAELSADPFRIVAASSAVYPQTTYEFRLEEIPLNANPGCEDFGPPVGFRLTRIDPAPGGTTSVIHEDKAIPASRHCPLGYRLGGVHLSNPIHAAEVVVVLVAVISQGFEGPDYRWLAVTYRPNEQP